MNFATPGQIHRILGVFSLLSLIALAGCSDGPTGPAGQPGVVSFGYQGPVSGTFRAEGDYRRTADPLGQTYAFGQRYSNPGAVEVVGNLLQPGDLVDGLRVRIPRLTVGSAAIDAAGCPWWEDACPGVFIFLRLLNRDGSQAEYSCELESGTISLTAVSDERAAGQFSGTGECMDPEGATSAFAVTGGTFDVPLHDASRG